jgi:hypothetical protein
MSEQDWDLQTTYIKNGKRVTPTPGGALLSAHLSRRCGSLLTVDLSDGRRTIMPEDDVHTAMHAIQELYPVGNRITVSDEVAEEL